MLSIFFDVLHSPRSFDPGIATRVQEHQEAAAILARDAQQPTSLRQTAFEALARLGDPQGRAIILDYCSSSQKGEIRSAAIQALVQLNTSEAAVEADKMFRENSGDSC